MRISAFTIARDAVAYGYPLAESIRSLLPLVDEYVVAVGDCDDGTWEVVAGIDDPRIRAWRTVWDTRRGHSLVLSAETNKALARCTGEWAIYLQADEVLHERDLAPLRAALERYRHTDIEALSFRYHHFYGSYGLVQNDPRRWYRRATRIVRTGAGVESVGDACAFEVRVGSGWRRPRRADLDLFVYHYGWAQAPAMIRRRRQNSGRLLRGEDGGPEGPSETDAELLPPRADLAQPFRGSHPAVMQARVAAQDWAVDLPPSPPPPLVWLHRGASWAGWLYDRLRSRHGAAPLR